MAESSTDEEKRTEIDYAYILKQKEHDIEIAAHIGQSLLERNRELQTRNEFLEESLNASNERAIQLRHELNRRIELVRFFSLAEEDRDGDDTRTAVLCRQLERLTRENTRLEFEHNSLRKTMEVKDAERHAHVTQLSAQLATATAQVSKLQTQIAEKNNECTAQMNNVNRLLDEIAKRSTREKELCEDNHELHEALEQASQRQNQLSLQMSAMQQMYIEVKTMFEEAEEELRNYRKKPSPYRTPSADSLYDSLASELENSEKEQPPPRVPSLPCTSSDSMISSSKMTPPLSMTNKFTPKQQLKEDDSKLTIEAASEEEEEATPIREMPSITQPEEGETTPIRELPSVIDKEVTGIRELPSYPSEPPPCRVSSPSPPVALERKSSSSSLSDYEAPSLGEPGVPGSRDLAVSIRRLAVRRKLEMDFARFRARRGLTPGSFFSPSKAAASESPVDLLDPLLVGDSRSLMPWRMCSSVGLEGVRRAIGGGVVSRAELPSSVRPSVGLPSPSLSSLKTVAPPSGGIILRKFF